ncbi:MAG: serine hydrolase, partial [Bellilinea sp.]
MRMEIDPIITALKQQNLQYAFYFKRPGQPAVLESNCDRFPSASIIKIPLLLTWVHLERQGQLDRGEICNLDAEPQVRGAGFAYQMATRKLPYHDVLLMMMALSDNLCTNLVIRRIGLERVQQAFREALGLRGTELQRKLMDFKARDRGLDNWVSAE